MGGQLRIGNITYNDHGTRDVRGTSSVQIKAGSFYFEPTFLRGTPGQRLRLEIADESGILHNFSLPAQQIDRDIPANGRTEVEVTFPQSGAVRFFCKYHTAQGMNGQLLAGDATPQPVTTAPSPSPARRP